MDWKAFAATLTGPHCDRPQVVAELERGVQEVRAGLEVLARHGFPFHLEPGSEVSVPLWPRLAFHSKSAPNGKLVHSSWEFDELGNGWFFTLGEAQHWDGTATQFAGRGGVPRDGLPATQSDNALVDLSPPKPDVEAIRASNRERAQSEGSQARGAGQAARNAAILE